MPAFPPFSDLDPAGPTLGWGFLCGQDRISADGMRHYAALVGGELLLWASFRQTCSCTYTWTHQTIKPATSASIAIVPPFFRLRPGRANTRPGFFMRTGPHKRRWDAALRGAGHMGWRSQARSSSAIACTSEASTAALPRHVGGAQWVPRQSAAYRMLTGRKKRPLSDARDRK
jgi:hypothetical protein